MSSSISFVALVLVLSVGQTAAPIKQEEVDYQNQVFQRWWETDLVWVFDDLPTEGEVPAFRIPYSGHDYPDRAGGTIEVMRKYDQAFNASRRRGLATEFERHDTTAFTEPTTERRGIFGLRRRTVERTPQWHGHCNGWTAAAIRHAEPQQSVTRHGVVFTPADIKGLLAEIYMYRDNEFLGGVDDAIHPATLHVVLSNWLGRGSHPVGIDTSVGKEVWNYPLYAYKTTSKKVSDQRVEVKMNAWYSQSTRQEVNRSQHLKKSIYFHYFLSLNAAGEIVGGGYYNDSARIDMVWMPLHPVQGGTPGNDRGNPHIDVKEVLAMWRESAPVELRSKWWNIDPTEEDIITSPGESELADGRVADELTESSATVLPEATADAEALATP